MYKPAPISRLSAPLRFRRWSRRAYAAFVSMQHTVTIGQLALRVADRFQQKNRLLHGAPAGACPEAADKAVGTAEELRETLPAVAAGCLSGATCALTARLAGEAAPCAGEQADCYSVQPIKKAEGVSGTGCSFRLAFYL